MYNYYKHTLSLYLSLFNPSLYFITYVYTTFARITMWFGSIASVPDVQAPLTACGGGSPRLALRIIRLLLSL